MKHIFLLLLLFTSLVRADEIGSQYKEQAEAVMPVPSIIWPIHTLAPTASRPRCGPRKPLKVAMSTPWGCSRKLYPGKLCASQGTGAAGNHCGSKRGAIMLARVLVNTQAGKTDYPQAIKLLQTATEDIDNDSAVDAQMLLGLIYANGVEVAQDDVQAASWFKRSSALSRGRRVLGRDVVQAG
jgi:hypothetical protein